LHIFIILTHFAGTNKRRPTDRGLLRAEAAGEEAGASEWMTNINKLVFNDSIKGGCQNKKKGVAGIKIKYIKTKTKYKI
jgi:hypothetical protein